MLAVNENIGTEPAVDFYNTSLYVNRELSWIDFNQRVLEEALNPEAHPLLERVKFISIFSSNLDEYFMIRVAGIEDQYQAGIQDRTIDGYTPAEQLEKIRTMVLQQLTQRNECFYNNLLPAMQKEGIEFLRVAELSATRQRALSNFFRKEIYPVLTNPTAPPHQKKPNPRKPQKRRSVRQD